MQQSEEKDKKTVGRFMLAARIAIVILAVVSAILISVKVYNSKTDNGKLPKNTITVNNYFC